MGWQLRLYLAVSRALPLIAPLVLRRRLARGKEDPARWREKLGQASAARPDGPLIWLHAVGLGEVLALRGLIGALALQRPELWFLVTSTTRASATVLAANLPGRTLHQFLPLDAPGYLGAFLDHWRPDLSVWAEQDLWPGAVLAADRRGIPLALVNARMNDAAYARRSRARRLFGDLYARFGLIAAQDAPTAALLARLGAVARIGPSLKAAAPALAADAQTLGALRRAVQGRRLWLAASTHAPDEAVALAAQAVLFAADPAWLLILAPRIAARGAGIVAGVQLPVTQRSAGQAPGGAVYVADTFGEMGLWYRLCPVTLIGGSFNAVEGHNPWEPAALGSAILHGPRTANFAADYALLGQGAARLVSADTLADALHADPAPFAARARALADAAQGSLAPLARDLIALMLR